MGLCESFRREWKYFTVEEVHSDLGLKYIRDYNAVKVEWDFMEVLVRFREYMDLPIVVNDRRRGLSLRGWRHWIEHNNIYVGMGKKVVLFSSHLDGRACDISCDGVRSDELYRRVLKFNKQRASIGEMGFTEVGVYGTFIHVGLRQCIVNKPVVWTGS